MVACVRHMVDGTIKREVRTFDTTTTSLLALADWLASEGCTVVAMEATGAPLERAIAASTAAPGIWPPITINGERYIDGGMRSMLNADLVLAIGFDIVIAVSCFPLTARDKAGPAFFTAMNAGPLAELDAVRGSGATLAVIEPHSEFIVLTKHGAAMMANSLVPEAYRLGHITAVGEAEAVRRVWNSH